MLNISGTVSAELYEEVPPGRFYTPELFTGARLDAALRQPRDVAIKLHVGAYVHILQQQNSGVSHLGWAQLDSFQAGPSTAKWVFTTHTGAIVEGSFESAKILDRVSVKLVSPILLLPSRRGFRMGFSFRSPAGILVVNRNDFLELARRALS